jgi:hypothetical protein
MPTYQVDVKEDYRPAPVLLHGAQSLLKLAALEPRGSHWKIMGALLLLSAAIEGFCNTVGPDMFGDAWEKKKPRMEKWGPVKKLRAIAKHVGMPFHAGRYPWKAMCDLVETRHGLMHPRPKQRHTTARVRCKAADYEQHIERVHAQAWAPLLIEPKAHHTMDEVIRGLEQLWVAAGLPRHAMRMHGFRVWGVSAAPKKK